MFRRHISAFSTWGPQAEVLAPETGAGGGGGAAPGGGAPAAGAAGDPTDAHAGGAPGDDDADAGDGGADDDDPDGADDDDDAADDREREELIQALPPEEQAKRRATWQRRSQRQLRKLRPYAPLLRGARGYMPPDELQEALGLARDMREVNAVLNAHPDLLQELVRRRNGGGRPAAAEPKAWKDPFADEANLPLDTKDPAGAFLVNHLRTTSKENFELRESLSRITELLSGLQQTEQHRTMQTVEQRWQTATSSAAARAGLQSGTPEHKQFVNNVYRTFLVLKAEKRLRGANLEQVIAQELKPYARGRRRAVTDAARRADHAATVPRPAGRGTTAAAAATDQNSKPRETLKDARRGFFQRVGQSPTPR